MAVTEGNVDDEREAERLRVERDGLVAVVDRDVRADDSTEVQHVAATRRTTMSERRTKPNGALRRVPGVRQAVAGRAGDVAEDVERSFESFVANEYARALAFARATSWSWSEAEDLTQEAFLAAFRKWEDVSGYERPAAFVRRVIANLQVSGVRRRVREESKRHLVVVEEAVDSDLGDPDFWNAMEKLPVRQRQVVALHYVDDLSVADIAAVLEIAEGTVKAHLHAARQTLAWVLGDETTDGEDA